MNDLLQKLEAIHFRFQEVGKLIVDPGIIADMKRYVKLNKEYKDLEEIDKVYHEYKTVIENIASTKELLEEENNIETHLVQNSNNGDDDVSSNSSNLYGGF